MTNELIKIARKKMNETEFKNMDFEDVAAKFIADLVYIGAYESSPKKTKQHEIIQQVAEEFELRYITEKNSNIDTAWAILEDESQERAFWEVVNDRIARTDEAGGMTDEEIRHNKEENKMETIIVRHIEENREYELHMIDMPENAEEYFNETIVGGYENWTWTGPGTVERKNYPSKEWAQVVD